MDMRREMEINNYCNIKTVKMTPTEKESITMKQLQFFDRKCKQYNDSCEKEDDNFQKTYKLSDTPSY